MHKKGVDDDGGDDDGDNNDYGRGYGFVCLCALTAYNAAINDECLSNIYHDEIRIMSR